MNIIECIHYDSRCYKLKGGSAASYPASMTGIVLHSTGEGSTALKRYVQPSQSDPKYDELIKLIGKNANGNSWNRDVSKGVHYMIGQLANKTIAAAQMLPENICAWGVGSGKKGSYNYNPAKIQIEMQDGNDINKVYPVAVELCADICKRHNWSAEAIVSHYETYKAGYGSGHSDPETWFNKYGKTMKQFRADVQAKLDYKPEPTPVPPTPVTPEPSSKIKVGDIVDFIGTKHFTNCNAADTKAKSCKPGKATVRGIYKNAKHPYLLKYVAGTGCTVNGFVNADTIEAKETPYVPVVNEIVYFTGSKQYSNSGKAADKYVLASEGTAVVKAIYKDAKHPYLIKGISVSGKKKASVNGFVDKDTITGIITATSSPAVSVKRRIARNVKRNVKDIISRALKTFVQAFISYILVDLQSVLEALRGGDTFEVITPILIGGCAAGISAIWNILITPSLDRAINNANCEDDTLYITIDDNEIEVIDDPIEDIPANFSAYDDEDAI